MKIEIENEQLKLYLQQRKKMIEFKKFSGIGEIISGISLIITLLCSDFKDSIIHAQAINIIFFIISFSILGYGVFMLINSLFNYFTIEICYRDICELDQKSKHRQNIIVMTDNSEKGRYLLVYNLPWKCYLFPSYIGKVSNSEDQEISHFKPLFNKSIGVKSNIIELNPIGTLNSRKINYAEKSYMNYEFHFYKVKVNKLDKVFNKKRFKYNGKKFIWMTLDEMYKSRNIMKKNKDVVVFINDLIGISK